MTLQDIIHIIESAAPLSYQEAWDNSGLQVGDASADIRAALLTTDITESVVGEAVSLGCNLIISHHPLLFRGLKHVCGTTPQERCVAKAIKQDIAIYSAHTSMDAYLRGVSGRMAETMGITDYRILVPAAGSESKYGLGVVGCLPTALSYETFLQQLKQRFGAPYLRYTRAVRESVQKVAFCGGAGAEFAESAIAAGADVYVTADVKYHEMQAADGQIALVDMDHWVSEHLVRDVFRELLQAHLPVYISQRDSTPVLTM